MIYLIGYIVGAVLTWILLLYDLSKYQDVLFEEDYLWLFLAAIVFPITLFVFIFARIGYALEFMFNKMYEWRKKHENR